MIKLQDLTPSVYYTKSRDFQFIGRLYDIVLNYIKTEADTLYDLPIGTNMDEKLLNLLALTLGFQSKHKYNSTQLRAICSVLPLVLRNKGSLNAILIAVNALLHAEGIKQPLDYSLEEKQAITLYLPQQLSDLTLLVDLLAYILPAGLGCRLVREISQLTTISTEIDTEDTVIVYANKDTTNPAILGQMIRFTPYQKISVDSAADFVTKVENYKALYYYDAATDTYQVASSYVNTTQYYIFDKDAVTNIIAKGAAAGYPGMLANTTILEGTLQMSYQEIDVKSTEDFATKQTIYGALYYYKPAFNAYEEASTYEAGKQYFISEYVKRD